jgi:hypothetical protein
MGLVEACLGAFHLELPAALTLLGGTSGLGAAV